ncbi:MAG: zinc ABC transporter substrate-binding protein [Oscillospiraceae bacterium]|nr:zinc ABC transporter substrate-binding protein [Oscillospiraceae bacterium]
MMKRIFSLFTALILLCLLAGCQAAAPTAQIAATTLPVYEFTARLCAGTDLSVTRLITDKVSCLHDYSLNVNQVRAAEAAQVIVLSGAGLEDFMADILKDKQTIDSSAGIPLLDCGDSHHHEDSHHHHEQDAHIWLSVENAKIMAENICHGLTQRYPQHAAAFDENLTSLHADMDKLRAYADASLANLSQRELITFHDGFFYLADAFDLTVLQAIEEESGSEASAQTLIHLINLVQDNHLSAVFTEANGSASAASILSAETGAAVYTLDMAMSGDSWFDAMYHNIDTLKEALE